MLALLLVVGSALQAPEPPPQAAKPPAGAAAKEANAPATPEKALRRFFVSMITQDEAAVREGALHNEDLEWLLKGPRPPADQMDKIKKSLDEAPLRVLKAGDVVESPRVGKVTIKPEEVSDDRAMIVLGGGPPLQLQKVDGRWRVDARPIIAARKAAAAAAARKKAG